MKKKSLIMYSLVALTAVMLALNIPVPPANALTTTQRTDARISATAARQSETLTRLIQRGDTLIAARLATLQKLLSRVQADKRLSDTDKTTLTSDIQSTVGSLQTLKAKIDADTDDTIARADVKSIITNYRIYVFYEPKIILLIVINNLQQVTTRLAALSVQLQSLLTTAKSQGKDTTAAQAALIDLNTQLATVSTTLSTDKTLLSNINITTTNPQSVFVQIRKDLATVRSEFAKIRSDIATMRATLKLVVKMNPTAASNSAH